MTFRYPRDKSDAFDVLKACEARVRSGLGQTKGIVEAFKTREEGGVPRYAWTTKAKGFCAQRC